MSEIKYSYDTVNFHKTFAPQDSYLSKILELASAAYSGTKEDISEVTGIPTGKTSGKSQGFCARNHSVFLRSRRHSGRR